MKTLVYVHGTNGSGKSTLARAVAAAAGGFSSYCDMSKVKGEKYGYTRTPAGVAFVGRYGSACGGIDGIQPYARVHEVLLMHALFKDALVFAEGLVTPGVATCRSFADLFDVSVFVHLDVPANECVAHVLKRRAVKGNTKPYDPANLYKKAQSAASWASRLKASGLEVKTLNYRQAYETTLDLLGLEMPSVEELLY